MVSISFRARAETPPREPAAARAAPCPKRARGDAPSAGDPTPAPGARRLASLALSLFALAGCGRDSGAGDTQVDAAAAQGPGRAIALADGREIRVRSAARRVFPASASVVDYLVDLTTPSRVAALPEQALDYTRLPAEPEVAAGWRGVPRFSAFLAETVVAAAPDLVLVEPSQDRGTCERLRAAGFELVELPEIRGWTDARATLLAVGAILGEEPRAKGLVEALDRRVERLAASGPARAGLRVLCYSNFGGTGWSAGTETTIHAEIVLAGLANVVADAGRVGHVQLTFEELIALDPDLILVSAPLPSGGTTQGDPGGASERVLRSEPSLQRLSALREGRILALPPSLYATSSHHLVDGAEELARRVDELLAAGRVAKPEPKARGAERR